MSSSVSPLRRATRPFFRRFLALSAAVSHPHSRHGIGAAAAQRPPHQVTVCAGEGPRYGDFKCNHDGTHRVCATLVANHTTSCDPLQWGASGSFWEITGQEQWNWKEKVCRPPNPGTNWCICMWAFARMIEKVGCANTHIDCTGTDLDFVLARFSDRGVSGRTYDLQDAHDCLKRKCVPDDEEVVVAEGDAKARVALPLADGVGIGERLGALAGGKGRRGEL